MNRLKSVSGVKLIFGYVALVTAVYVIGLVFPDSTRPLLALFMLALPFSLLVGLVSVSLTHSGYGFPLDIGLLLCAVVNCLCFYFLKNRFSSRRNVERSADNGDL